MNEITNTTMRTMEDILSNYEFKTANKLDSNFNMKKDEVAFLKDILLFYQICGKYDLMVSNIDYVIEKAHSNPFGVICAIVTDCEKYNNIYRLVATNIYKSWNLDTDKVQSKLYDIVISTYGEKGIPKSKVVINLINCCKETAQNIDEFYNLFENKLLADKKDIYKNSGIPKNNIFESLSEEEISEMLNPRICYVYVRIFKRYNTEYIAYIGSGNIDRVNQDRSTEFATELIRSIKNSTNDRIIVLRSYDSLEEARLAESALIRYFRDHDYNTANIVNYEMINGSCPETREELNHLLSAAKKNISYLHDRKLKSLKNKKFMTVNEFEELFNFKIK